MEEECGFKRKANTLFFDRAKERYNVRVFLPFENRKSKTTAPSFAATKANSIKQWRLFWDTGGAIDFSANQVNAGQL